MSKWRTRAKWMMRNDKNDLTPRCFLFEDTPLHLPSSSGTLQRELVMLPIVLHHWRCNRLEACYRPPPSSPLMPTLPALTILTTAITTVGVTTKPACLATTNTMVANGKNTLPMTLTVTLTTLTRGLASPRGTLRQTMSPHPVPL